MGFNSSFPQNPPNLFWGVFLSSKKNLSLLKKITSPLGIEFKFEEKSTRPPLEAGFPLIQLETGELVCNAHGGGFRWRVP